MININDISDEAPYKEFTKFYKKALRTKQKNIEAVCISSFDSISKESNSRFVNLKYIIGDEWIFFSNYSSPKADEFVKNPNISAVFFWSEVNIQIRMKAKIYKTDTIFSDKHFKNRDKSKNALAILSEQSKFINNYDSFLNTYKNTIKDISETQTRPSFWGGYTFKPYFFEFWQGHKKRVNKREVFKSKNNKWETYFLQP